MADDEQFSLCWNNFNSNLSAGFHDSLVQGDLVDVTLAAEGHLVKAHRLILSVCSPYFRKMFMQMPVNQHAFIFLKDVSHSVLKDLIQFMYCGEVNVKQEALPGFISTAEALQIKGLTETGDSAPPQASPAKEIPSTPAPVSISTANTVPPRGKSQRTRVQSFKLESEESGDDKIVQIQTPASHHHSASASQQVQQVQQLHVASGQKRVLGQRHVQASQITKRAKISLSSADVLDPSDNTTQIQTVQIIKQLPSQPAEPEYVDLAMEAINAKPEPDYAEEPAEIETVEAETEQDQSLTENEQTADQEQEHGDDGDQYVDDDAYGELSKYEESYFTEAEDAKPGASGFGESYASDGTSNEQTSQDVLLNSYTFIPERPPPLNEQEPLPKVWYSTSLTFAPNRRGTMNLHFGGYVYVHKKRHNRTMNWLCCKGSNTIKSRCKARVSTEGNNKIRFGTHGHNHPATELKTAQKMFYCDSKHVSDSGENFDELQFSE
ncbi:modifier of mdg4-like isoform X9 [Anopheles aquasalis]|uniref:modifier of mdg4-like isoform X9 n=1 Tax=Anopheles aquasalis TaxID=42839 RepID=UPI00215A6196|nr:modifier of mdg4-like isoform X9 [Anopheles aquasalis]XP_050084770.1 modifier of mdg4-like isoform X9 [Anopheles aquasalis]